MVIAGLLELPVDNVLEVRFVALHGGGAKVGGIPVSGLMVLEPVADLTAIGGLAGNLCRIIWGMACDGYSSRCAEAICINSAWRRSRCRRDMTAHRQPMGLGRIGGTIPNAATSSSSISTLVTQVRSGIGWFAIGEPAVTTCWMLY